MRQKVPRSTREIICPRTKGGSLLVRIGALSSGIAELLLNLHIYRAPYGAIAELDSGTVAYTTPGNRSECRDRRR